MKAIFGVNSTTPVNKKLKNGYTMFDWIKRKKCFPCFCMRTLRGEDQITNEEIEFLKNKDCKIALVVRDLSETHVSANNGTQDALKTVQAAKELGVPSNIGLALFVEIKPEWSINHNWMISFAQTLLLNGYVPAFIGNSDSAKNFNFNRQCSHFAQATADVNLLNALFMVTEPKRENMPIEWEPYCPSVFEPNDIHIWSCGMTTFDDIQVEDVYAREFNVLDKMW